MKITVKTGIINSMAFLTLSVLAVFFFQISTRNIIIQSQSDDLEKTAEHLLFHEEFTHEPQGKGKFFYDEKRYSLLSEGIYLAIIDDERQILQDPFILLDKPIEGVFFSDDDVFLGIRFDFEGKDYLVAGNITPEYNSINRFKTTSSIFIIITIVLSLILGIITTRISMNPWKKFLNIIKKINTSDLSKRFEVDGKEDEIREMEQSLNAMLERLEMGFELQKRFSSDAAHELRTPVTSIKGYAQILQKWGLDDKNTAEESVDSIVETVGEMEELIEKLLTLSRLETDTVQRQPFNTEDWIVSLKKSLRRNYNRTILFENRQFAKTLNSSAQYLNMLIAIFVDNAVKYSEETEPVTIRFDNRSISIIDRGIGIPKNEIEHIFERFYQVDVSRAKTEQKGFGIGLSIAKKIIQLLDIRLTVNSSVNQGTEITLTIKE